MPDGPIDSYRLTLHSFPICQIMSWPHISDWNHFFLSQNRAFERSWWSRCPTSRCTARSCPTRCTRSSPPTSSPSSSSSSRTRTTKCGKPARRPCLFFSSRGWSTRLMSRSRWARSKIDVNDQHWEEFGGQYISHNHLTPKLCFEISVKTCTLIQSKRLQ